MFDRHDVVDSLQTKLRPGEKKREAVNGNIRFAFVRLAGAVYTRGLETCNVTSFMTQNLSGNCDSVPGGWLTSQRQTLCAAGAGGATAGAAATFYHCFPHQQQRRWTSGEGVGTEECMLRLNCRQLHAWKRATLTNGCPSKMALSPSVQHQVTPLREV